MNERRLGGYLLLPRPGDLVKAWIFPACFLLGVLAAEGASGREVLRAALVWAALELLLYQARYQWNDIRGFEADQRHPDRAARGRLPGPPSRGRGHIRASAAVAAARLGLAAALALALPGLDLGVPLLALALVVFAVAAVYEPLRARCTGGSDRVPPPLGAGIVALWVVVGAGYAIRGTAGLAMAVGLSGRPGVFGAAVVALWAFGVAFVTGRWALEALAFGRRDSDGGIAWRVEPGQAREHSLALVRWLPAIVPESAGREADGSLAGWRALTGAVAPLAPWNVAALVAAAAAAATGRLLAGPADAFDVLLATGAGALCAAAVLAARRRRWVNWLLGACALAAVMAIAGSPRPVFAGLPWLCVLGAHLFFASQSPRTLAHPLRGALATARSGHPPSRRRPLSAAALPGRKA
jgi:hypothetical protein